MSVLLTALPSDRLTKMMLTLVLGGARSGKSRYAQSLCNSSMKVIYVATARVSEMAGDREMRDRVAYHRASRPTAWQTVEESLDLSRTIREAPEDATLLVDCATLWLSNLLWECRTEIAAEQNRLILAHVDRLVDTVRCRAESSLDAGEVIVVSNEVGSGLVPEHPVGRAFRDLQGFANQRLAQAADRAIFMIAGLPLRLK